MGRVSAFAILWVCLCCSFAAGQEKDSKPLTKAAGGLDILSDTKGVNFGPYLQHVLRDIRNNWYPLVPESARPPQLKQGSVVIEFSIKKDGKVDGMHLVSATGDEALDKACWRGIADSSPFESLPKKFTGNSLALRFRFYYNPPQGKIPDEPKKD